MRLTVERILASALIVLALSFSLAAAQKAEESKEIIKAFPPALSARFTDAQKDVELAKAQLEAAQSKMALAQSNVRLLLYAAADEIELTKVERETCPFAQNSNGGWIFKCPAPTKPEAKKPEVKP